MADTPHDAFVEDDDDMESEPTTDEETEGRLHEFFEQLIEEAEDEDEEADSDSEDEYHGSW